MSKRTDLRTKWLLGGLVCMNMILWGWALVVFRGHATLIGSALLAWTYGLRHAVDADHIAAIDNVTRKLMQQNQRPVAVGAFFSLGHSTIVILASLGVAGLTSHFTVQMEKFHLVGSIFGTLISAAFLFVLALVNFSILCDVYKRFKRVKQGQNLNQDDLDTAIAGGLMSRIYRRLFALVQHSWQMYLIGFLFGLGFDTATEIGVLGLSAAGSSSGLSIWSIMLFPALFTAAMALVDSLDNVVMIKAYGWAFHKPMRKLYYNMTITASSVVIALVIGGIEALGLLADRCSLEGGIWTLVRQLSEHLGNAGFGVIALMVVCWGLSILNYRWRGYDRIEHQA